MKLGMYIWAHLKAYLINPSISLCVHMYITLSLLGND
jgi:hypothetical protein